MMHCFYPCHLVSVSPWPLLSSFGVMFIMLSSVQVFIEYSFCGIFISGLNMTLICIQWWRDVIRESTYQGSHSILVKKGLKIGMLLFILSELMLFLSFFWAYFHLYLSPGIELGGMFPSLGIKSFNPLGVPMLNTVILLSSGVFITWAHHSLLNGNKKGVLLGVKLTLISGVIFTIFQYMEYKESFFSISDSSYGSIFFMATGFHGIHVIVGTLFIFVNFFRIKKSHISSYHHFGFEAASWYWHFVDIVWLFLYVFVYWLSI